MEENEELELDLQSMIQVHNTSKYLPQMDILATRFFQAHKGGGINDLANFLMVGRKTVKDWILKYPSFAKAVHAGMQNADVEVANALFLMATKGVEYKEEVAFLDKESGEIVTKQIIKEKPASEKAAIAWLARRMPDQWGDDAKKSAPVQVSFTIEDGLEEPPMLSSDSAPESNI